MAKTIVRPTGAPAGESASLREQQALKRLQEISVEILSQLELDPLLGSILKGVVELLGADSGNFYRYDPQRDELHSSVLVGRPEHRRRIVLKRGGGAAGKVLATGRPIKVDDYDSWEGRSPQWPRGVVGPVIEVPALRGEEFLGVLVAERRPGRTPFTDQDVDLLQLFANQAAVAIANAQLYEATRKNATQLARLQDTSVDIAGQLEVPRLLQLMIQRISELLEAGRSNAFLVDEETNVLVPWAALNLPPPLDAATYKPGEGLVGKVWESGEAIIVEDYDSWEGRAPWFPTGLVGRALAVPMRHGQRTLGVLTATRDAQQPPFDESHENLLSLFANQAAVAIANARLYEETKRSAEKLSSLHQTSIDITRQLELDPLLQSILSRVVELLDADSGELYLYDPQRDELHRNVPLGLAQGLTDSALMRDLKRDEGLAGKVLATRNPIKVDNYDTWEGRLPDWPYGIVGAHSAAPIQRGEEFLGVILVARKPGKPPFTGEDISLLQLFANQTAVAIANARLYEETKTSAEQLSSLYETSLELASQLEPQKLLEAIVLRTERLLQGQAAGIVLYDPSRRELRDAVIHTSGEREPFFDQLAVKPGEGLDGKVFASGEPMIVADYNTWEGRVPNAPPTRFPHVVAVPIKLGAESLGTLKVSRRLEDAHFSAEDVRLLTLLANQAAVAISNARLYEQTRRSAEELSTLYDTSLELTSQLEPQKLLESIALRAWRLLQAKVAEILLYDPQAGALRDVVLVSRGELRAPSAFLSKPGEGIDGRVYASGRPLVVENYNLWKGRVPDMRPLQAPRMAVVPIKQGNQTLGTLKVRRFIQDPPFSEEEVRLLTLFANQAAVAIANARLYEEAKRSAEELARLYETSIDITRQLALPELLEAIMVRATDLLGGTGGIFFLYNPATGKLHPQGQYRRRVETPQITLAPGEGLAGAVYVSGKPMAVEDYDTWKGRSLQWPYGQLARLAAAPMLLGERCLGVIIVDRNRESPPFSPQDLQLLSLFANQAAVALANAQQYEELQQLYSQVKEKERLESELRVAHSIQQSLLPQELPKIRGWELAALWTAARVISGDFYDVFPVPGGRWGFVIADVSGKGVPAALFMALCRTIVRTFCLDGRPPAEAIARANNVILADARTDWFVTLFYGLLDPKWGILSYVNAGHPPPLLHRRSEGETQGLRTEGMALGVVPGLAFQEKSLQMEPGDLLLLYTDGLSEAADPQGRLYGARRLRALLREKADERPAALLAQLRDEIGAFARGQEFTDDLTAVLLRRSARR